MIFNDISMDHLESAIILIMHHESHPNKTCHTNLVQQRSCPGGKQRSSSVFFCAEEASRLAHVAELLRQKRSQPRMALSCAPGSRRASRDGHGTTGHRVFVRTQRATPTA